MCGFDYDNDGTYLGSRPSIKELQDKREAAWLADNPEDEAWAEFELTLATKPILN